MVFEAVYTAALGMPVGGDDCEATGCPALHVTDRAPAARAIRKDSSRPIAISRVPRHSRWTWSPPMAATVIAPPI